LEHRADAHILIAFLAYCLQVTLKQRLLLHAPGLTPTAVLEKLTEIKMIDVWIPTVDQRWLILPRYNTAPSRHQSANRETEIAVAEPAATAPSRAKTELRVRRKAENNSRVRFLRPEEEKRLRKVIRSNAEWAEHEPELDLAMHTGLRRSSLYQHLVWENVDLSARVAIIPKTKKWRTGCGAPERCGHARALSVFRSRGDATGRVVRNAAGETLNTNAHWFIPALRAAGIKNFKWHDCRHHYASMLCQTGTPLGNIAELLGHKGLAMTRRYAQLSISNLHEAVARIEKPVEAIDTSTDTRPLEQFATVQ
jgi:integrase